MLPGFRDGVARGARGLPWFFLGDRGGGWGVPEQETYFFFMCICFVVLLNSGVEGCSCWVREVPFPSSLLSHPHEARTKWSYLVHDCAPSPYFLFFYSHQKSIMKLYFLIKKKYRGHFSPHRMSAPEVTLETWRPAVSDSVTRYPPLRGN